MYIASNGIKTAVIFPDPDPESPREWENPTTMICWHNRYNLGDKHNFDDSQELAEHLAGNWLDTKDLFSIVHAGHVTNLRLHMVESMRLNDVEIGPHYELQWLSKTLGGGTEWCGTSWRCTKDLEFITSGGNELEEFFEVLNTRTLMQLLSNSDKIAILPLYLYDHSGLSMSTSDFGDRWDSGCVGFIYMDKGTAIKELALPTDKIRLAQPFLHQQFMKVPCKDGQTAAEAMMADGYKPVRKEDILNPESNVLYDHWMEKDVLYKRNNYLYVIEPSDDAGSVLIRGPVASFNPNLEPLTDENWKGRALEIMKGEVEAYDCYLRGQVYGYETYKGMESVESVVGFNPGKDDIRDVIKDELFSWFGPGMEFEYSSQEEFDIEDFFNNRNFPALRAELTEQVKSLVEFEDSTSEIYPFAMSAEDILANKDNILTEIVEELYDEHINPDSDRVYEAIESHAGIARELQPTLSVKDLDPEKDYTQDELMAILNKKPSLADQISGAKARQEGKGSCHKNRAPEQER